ncbi:methylated-DNA--[protein]-cysteine S-methyltransferase [Leucobacter sp. CSA2]|uniref:Methylated-DNA--protein-cysteine methyltransferase n=1 Tax=Leucobacter edaphi TaxID=2796472 RepID=A0A934QD82_9MICO|nr:methylated-DNA--[protein]-cysteine S-methyltransferase [Leucobacter edaphi]MBK0422068.1 methylated-DNA--[protein]-cysteine S-methyltransferase [Leucobacter edaphi]
MHGNPEEPSFEIEENELRRLRARLASEAGERELIDVSYRTVDSPVGELLLAATGSGLVRVAFAREDFDLVLSDIAVELSPRILKNPEPLDTAARELEEYFSGIRSVFDLPLDHTLSTGFRLAVQEFLPEITYGTTLSYTEVARAVGNPKAVRAVGSACATNPLPIVVPCHRVLRRDGTLGGYIGGLEAKTALLELEHVP